jgi:hypothetical protein
MSIDIEIKGCKKTLANLLEHSRVMGDIQMTGL